MVMACLQGKILPCKSEEVIGMTTDTLEVEITANQILLFTTAWLVSWLC